MSDPQSTGASRRTLLKGAAAAAVTGSTMGFPFVHAQEKIVLRYLGTAGEASRAPRMLLSDESAVEQIAQALEEWPGECWVVTPQPSYEQLTLQSCESIVRWQQDGCGEHSFSRWCANGAGRRRPGLPAGSWVLRKHGQSEFNSTNPKK